MTPAPIPPWYSHLPRAVLYFPVFVVAFAGLVVGGLVWLVVEMVEEEEE